MIAIHFYASWLCDLVYIRKWYIVVGTRRDPFPFRLLSHVLFLRSTNLWYFCQEGNEVEIAGCPGEDHPEVKIKSWLSRTWDFLSSSPPRAIPEQCCPGELSVMMDVLSELLRGWRTLTVAMPPRNWIFHFISIDFKFHSVHVKQHSSRQESYN